MGMEGLMIIRTPEGEGVDCQKSIRTYVAM